MNYFKIVVAVWLAFPLSAWAAEKIYFNERGQLLTNSSAAAYERQYNAVGDRAKVQDFYYPSKKKHSDPYEVMLTDVKAFVPKLPNGTLTLWHDNGNRKMVAGYRNGVPHGMWTNWYPEGTMSAQMPYVNGKTEGTGSRYYRNGRKESEIQFRNDKAEGVHKQWYPSGRPKSESVIHNDHVVQMISWEESGRLTSELSIKNGKRSGVVLEWYPDGS